MNGWIMAFTPKTKNVTFKINYMQKILDQIKEMNEVAGLRIVENIFDYGSCSVVDRAGKSVFRGDIIMSHVFIKKEYDRLKSLR